MSRRLHIGLLLSRLFVAHLAQEQCSPDGEGFATCGSDAASLLQGRAGTPAVPEKTKIFEGTAALLREGATQTNQSEVGLELALISTNHKTAANAVVTSICGNEWVPGALALAGSIKKTKPQSAVVIIVSMSVSDEYRKLLGGVFDKVYQRRSIKPHPSITRAAADCVTLKLWSWALAYKKVMYVDSDVLMFTSPDPIFETYQELAAKEDKGAPNVMRGPGKGKPGWNSGFFILQPSWKTLETLSEAVHTYEKDEGALNGDQQFLDHMFPRCTGAPGAAPQGTAGCWSQEIDSPHNVFARHVNPSDVNSLLLGQFNTIKSLHFSGSWDSDHKPWFRQCDVPSDVVGTTANTELHLSLLTLWFRYFESAKSLLNMSADKKLLEKVVQCPCHLKGEALSCSRLDSQSRA